MSKIGILHPGEMGISIAAAARDNGHEVYWVSTGRSDQTRVRAGKQNLHELTSLVELAVTSNIILSICPPHAAENVAEEVIRAGYQGLYLDANAISPQRSIRISKRMEAAGISYVDGGIIGGPAWERDGTCLYLSGTEAERIAGCFSNGPLETRIIGSQAGKASALKMCYAAYSKGTSALLSAILAAAESFEIRDELYRQWDADEEGYSEQVNRRAVRVTRKAWRFEGEMREIADTFGQAGLPDGFHDAAAEVFHRMAGFKGTSQLPELDQVLKSLLSRS